MAMPVVSPLRVLSNRGKGLERETGGRRERQRERENSNYSKTLNILKDSSRETDKHTERQRQGDRNRRATDGHIELSLIHI